MAAVYGIQGVPPAGFPPLAAAAAAAAPPAPPAPPAPALGPIEFDGTQARIDLIQPPGAYPIPGYAMPYANYELLGQHLDFYYSMTPARTPGATAAPNPRGIALATIKATLKLPTSPLKTPPNNWSNNRINSFVDNVDGIIPALAPGAVFDPNVFAPAILNLMNNLARQNANRGGVPALAAPIPITRAQIGI
jgi:hypothetical protein